MGSSLNGTGLTFSTGATLNSPPVTSVVAGGGLTGGTITTTGTIAIDTSTYAIGQIINGRPNNNTTYSTGATVAGSSLYQMATGTINRNGSFSIYSGVYISPTLTLVNTGTWKSLSTLNTQLICCGSFAPSGLWIRIS
jgi:hypothetical protein